MSFKYRPTLAKPGRMYALAAGLVSLTLVVAACGGGSSSTESTPAPAASEAAPAASEAAPAASEAAPASAIDAAYAELVNGSWTLPPTTVVPGVAGKTIMLESCGEANDNCVDMGNGVRKAAEILGWKVELCDGALDAAKYAACFRQAVAQGVDGVIALGTDCPVVKAPLKEAVAAGIKVVGVHSFDCDELDPTDTSLFSTQISYGDRAADSPDMWRNWGAAQAVAAVKWANGGAILHPVNKEYASFKFMDEGWYPKVAEICPDCVVIDLPWTVSEAGPKIEAKVQAALLKNPEITVVTAATNAPLGFLNGVKLSGMADKVKVIEGHGSITEGEWVRSGEMAALVGWINDWWGFAAVDALNSDFAGVPQEDSGIGFAIIDAENNLYPSGEAFQGQGKSPDLAALYASRWGK